MSESWRGRIHEPVVIIEGDDELFRGQVCITSDTRPHPRHAWQRAAAHIVRMLDVPFVVREAAVFWTLDVVDEIRIYHEGRPKPPKFSWKGIPGKL